MKSIYQVSTTPVAKHENMLLGKNYRITILTESLIRFEYSEKGQFEDRPTQMVWNRDFPIAQWKLNRLDVGVELYTDVLTIYYNEKEFSKHGLRIEVKGNLSAYHSAWNYSEEINTLGGTAKTLDFADGAIPLETGIISRTGFSMLDDSKTLVLLEDGWVEPRNNCNEDFYIFGYGHDYKKALKDFYFLCGKTPLLPRFALGNWWSRYYKYTEKSYLELMDCFDSEKLPFSVAVIDMDWHITEVDPKYGSGWTGYSWNREFFPDPRRFLGTLKERGLVTTLNVHPADGIRGFEDCYEEIANALGVNTELDAPIVFDASNPEFFHAYFEHVHHPLEKDGVDFWWVDWQQKGGSKEKGYDPLWMLNHYHFLDNGKLDKRPMTFSRYAGPGSHRYPVGFSGDSITTWESLEFQPYFTANASNIGYGWWSHDIGGHMRGYKDDELTTRWVQFGIFSPIMRLHSSSSPFNGKEPWRFKKEAESAMGKALRLRHAMIPYLYTMNYRSYNDDLPICLPMYYEHPEAEMAYQVPNQYYFGDAMIVSPITSPRIKNLNVAKNTVWLPDGIYYDFYSNMVYHGNRSIEVYRELERVPVFIKAGSILPLTVDVMESVIKDNPKSLEVRIYCGAQGTFSMYEDDNQSCQYQQEKFVLTEMKYCESMGQRIFSINGIQNDLKLVPEKRNYEFAFIGIDIQKDNEISVCLGEQEFAYKKYYRDKMLIVVVEEVSVEQTLCVAISGDTALAINDTNQLIFDFLNQAEISFATKEKIYQAIETYSDSIQLLSHLFAMGLDSNLYGALIEILTA